MTNIKGLDLLFLNDFKQKTKDEKLQELNKLAESYYVQDISIVSDETYDACVSNYESEYGEFTHPLGRALDAFEKYNHFHPVTSLAKINTKEQYDEICAKFEYDIMIQPKIDGLTAVVYPNGKIVSRGNGSIGEVLPWAHLIEGLPTYPRKPIRIEIFIENSVYEKEYKNVGKAARNIAAGILRRKDYTKEIKNLSYYAYNIVGSNLPEFEQLRIIKDNGFKTVPYIIETHQNLCDVAFNNMKNFVESHNAPTDGAVIKYGKANGLEKFGSTAHHPNNMVAFKFASEVKETILKDVIWQPGKEKYTPVGVFEPVTLGGSLITRASLHNINIINKLDVSIGSVVGVTLKNEIIPQIVSVKNEEESERKAIKIIEKCIYCGTDIEINDSMEPVCKNPDCEMKIISTISKLVSKEGLNIVGVSDATIKNYVELNKGIIPFDFLNINKEGLNKIGFTESATKMLKEIKTKRTTTLPKFIYACNIDGIGEVAAKNISEKFNNDYNNFIENFEKAGKEIDGIGQVMYDNIVNALERIKKNSEYVKFSNMETTKKTNCIVFSITGTLKKSRSEIADDIDKAGHIFLDNITKKVNYLVVGDNVGESKLTKANKYGIKIIKEEELYNLLKNEE